jgi:sigma-E factor negative regulatory protein RseB
MSNARLDLRAALPLVILFASPGADAADDAHAWLTRMSEAARTLNFTGTFVYQHDNQLDSMRIVHKLRDGRAHERLVSLTGVAREVVRDEREVRCYLPDQNSVVVEHRKADGRRFPAILPPSARELERSYRITLGKQGRVADRRAQAVRIEPKDGYRYGYHLWADRDTGLLLKASLIDEQQRVVEQFLFTEITIGGEIPDSELEPRNPAKDYVWYRSNGLESGKEIDSPKAWSAGQLPEGFALTMHVTRKVPTRRLPVEHMVFSDGLAVVSVFVERLGERGADAADPSGIEGLTEIGAVHALGRVVGDHQVTVVGEVPAQTVELIAAGIEPVK